MEALRKAWLLARRCLLTPWAAAALHCCCLQMLLLLLLLLAQ
eukprot:COSAG01_NODE_129_length_24935_cov_39.324368_2_plen_42_part_00